MKIQNSQKLKDIEEALLVIQQRKALNLVISFLILHGAEQDLIDAVEQAIGDNGQYADPRLEARILP